MSLKKLSIFLSFILFFSTYSLIFLCFHPSLAFPLIFTIFHFFIFLSSLSFHLCSHGLLSLITSTLLPWIISIVPPWITSIVPLWITSTVPPWITSTVPRALYIVRPCILQELCFKHSEMQILQKSSLSGSEEATITQRQVLVEVRVGCMHILS
jgi:hypothetical protein